MNLFVFNIKNLKRKHLNSLIPSAISILLAVLAVGQDWVPESVISGYNLLDKIFFPLIIVLSIAWSAISKNMLNRIKAIKDKEQKITEFEKFATKRMWGLTINLIILAIYWAITQGTYMFYFLVLLFILQVAFYPRKQFIAAELKDEEIIIE